MKISRDAVTHVICEEEDHHKKQHVELCHKDTLTFKHVTLYTLRTHTHSQKETTAAALQKTIF